MHITSTACEETLSLLTVVSEDEGSYTCVARNKFGEGNSTIEVKIIGKSYFNHLTISIRIFRYFQHVSNSNNLIVGDQKRFIFCSRQWLFY